MSHRYCFLTSNPRGFSYDDVAYTVIQDFAPKFRLRFPNFAHDLNQIIEPEPGTPGIYKSDLLLEGNQQVLGAVRNFRDHNLRVHRLLDQ